MDGHFGCAVFQMRSCWCLAQGHKHFPIASWNTSPDTYRISFAFFPNCSIFLAQKGSSSYSSLFVSTDELKTVAGKLISLGLYNLTLKLKMNPFICLFLTCFFFGKLRDFLLQTDTPGAVLSTKSSWDDTDPNVAKFWRDHCRHGPIELFLSKFHIDSLAADLNKSNQWARTH